MFTMKDFGNWYYNLIHKIKKAIGPNIYTHKGIPIIKESNSTPLNWT